MNHYEEAVYKLAKYNTRRYFLRQCTAGLGAMALGSLLGCGNSQKETAEQTLFPENPLNVSAPHFAPKAKKVIFLHMAGAPSQLELFDYKPKLQELNGKPCPASLLEGKRFAFLQGTPNMMGPQASFRYYGQSGAWISDHLPHCLCT